MRLENQPDAIPTNKTLVLGIVTILLINLDGVILEVWPAIAPSEWGGPRVTLLISGVIGYLAAWLVPDRLGEPR